MTRERAGSIGVLLHHFREEAVFRGCEVPVRGVATGGKIQRRVERVVLLGNGFGDTDNDGTQDEAAQIVVVDGNGFGNGAVAELKIGACRDVSDVELLLIGDG